MARTRFEGDLSAFVGGFLKQELKRQGITQEKFSYMVGCDVKTVYRWCRGEIHTLDALGLISSTLGVPMRDIFSEWDDVPHHQFKKVSDGNCRLFLLPKMLVSHPQKVNRFLQKKYLYEEI